jgi:hypothetical protein
MDLTYENNLKRYSIILLSGSLNQILDDIIISLILLKNKVFINRSSSPSKLVHNYGFYERKFSFGINEFIDVFKSVFYLIFLNLRTPLDR